MYITISQFIIAILFNMPEVDPKNGEVSFEARPDAEQLYSPKYISLLTVNSYRFSQGSVLIQRPLLRYLVNKFTDRFSSDAIEDAHSITVNTVGAVRNNPLAHPQTDKKGKPMGKMDKVDVDEDVRKYTNHLVESLSSKKEFESDAEDLMESMVDRDLTMLGLDDQEHSKGRDRKLNKYSSPFTDPNLSQWIYFGILGQSTGIPEYDRVFRDLEKAFDNINSADPRNYADMVRQEKLRRKVKRLIDFHFRYHPDQIDLLPPKYQDMLEE